MLESQIKPHPDLTRPRVLLIVCGAIAREVVQILTMNDWHHIRILCLPAHLHNTPGRIADCVREKIQENRPHFDVMFVGYADCGTGGRLDDILREEGVERISGPHCYSFFATAPVFEAMALQVPATFYLSDFLVRHFDRLVVKGCGLDRHPALQQMLFGRYRRLVYLAQTEDADLTAKARAAAERLGLSYERHRTGYGELATFISRAASSQHTPNKTLTDL